MGNLSRTIRSFGNTGAFARCIVVICAAIVPSTHSARGAGIPCSYEVTAIIQAPDGPFGLDSPTTGTGISPNGRYVCGFYNPGAIGNNLAFVYDTKTSEFITLPNPSGINLVWGVGDVNDAGQVVGEHGGSAGDFGFIYDLNTGQYTQLPAQAPGGRCSINAINSQGTVCGFRSIENGGDPVIPWNAFIWSPKKGFTDLGVMNGPNSSAEVISESGIVSGWTGSSLINGQAFVYQDGNTTLIGPIPGGLSSRPSGINDSPVIVGSGRKAVNGTTPTLPFYFDESGYHILPTLPNLVRGAAADIGTTGLILGSSSKIDATDFRACIWWNDQVFDMNELALPVAGLYLRGCVAIANDGQMIADSHLGSDLVAALLLPAEATIGDVTCDSKVDVDDLLLLINNWGSETSNADMDGDGIVNISDLLILIENWTPL